MRKKRVRLKVAEEKTMTGQEILEFSLVIERMQSCQARLSAAKNNFDKENVQVKLLKAQVREQEHIAEKALGAVGRLQQELNKAKADHTQYFKSLSDKYQLPARWGFDPATGKIVESEEHKT
jgi:hypothetical protein